LNIESQIKSYKFEYDQLTKNMSMLKKQHVCITLFKLNKY